MFVSLKNSSQIQKQLSYSKKVHNFKNMFVKFKCVRDFKNFHEFRNFS